MARIQPTTVKAFRNFVESQDASTLQEMESQLAELVAHPGWAIVTEMLGQGRENMIQAMTTGVKEHEEYAHLGGYVAGLEESVNAVEAVKAEAERRRREISQRAEAERRAQEGE